MPQDSDTIPQPEAQTESHLSESPKTQGGTFFALKEDIDVPKYYKWLKDSPKESIETDEDTYKKNLPFWRVSNIK